MGWAAGRRKAGETSHPLGYGGWLFWRQRDAALLADLRLVLRTTDTTDPADGGDEREPGSRRKWGTAQEAPLR